MKLYGIFLALCLGQMQSALVHTLKNETKKDGCIRLAGLMLAYKHFLNKLPKSVVLLRSDEHHNAFGSIHLVFKHFKNNSCKSLIPDPTIVWKMMDYELSMLKKKNVMNLAKSLMGGDAAYAVMSNNYEKTWGQACQKYIETNQERNVVPWQVCNERNCEYYKSSWKRNSADRFKKLFDYVKEKCPDLLDGEIEEDIFTEIKGMLAIPENQQRIWHIADVLFEKGELNKKECIKLLNDPILVPLFDIEMPPVSFERDEQNADTVQLLSNDTVPKYDFMLKNSYSFNSFLMSYTSNMFICACLLRLFKEIALCADISNEEILENVANQLYFFVLYAIPLIILLPAFLLPNSVNLGAL